MDPIQRHVAGATVVHIGPFSELQVPVSDQPLSVSVRETWVRPLYLGLSQPHIKQFVAQNLSLVTDDLISGLLASFDWRPRTAAAYLLALSNRQGFTSHIGRLLLRSDVCFAGSAYCIALAEFNSAEGVAYLNDYLAYYLTRQDLWFDQGQVMGALSYLDRQNRTALLSSHLDAWGRFIENRPHWSLDANVAKFDRAMEVLRQLKVNDV